MKLSAKKIHTFGNSALSAYCPNTYCEFRRTRNVSGQGLLKHCDRKNGSPIHHIDNFQYLNFRLGIKKKECAKTYDKINQ